MTPIADRIKLPATLLPRLELLPRISGQNYSERIKLSAKATAESCQVILLPTGYNYCQLRTPAERIKLLLMTG